MTREDCVTRWRTRQNEWARVGKRSQIADALSYIGTDGPEDDQQSTLGRIWSKSGALRVGQKCALTVAGIP